MQRLYRPLDLVLALLLIAANLLILTVPVSAASLTSSYIRLNRMGTSDATTFRVVFRTSSAGATSVVINFNGADTTSWTGQSGSLGAQGSQTDDNSSCATELGGGVVGLPGTHSFTVSGGTLTIGSVTALSTTTTYCDDLTFASAVTAPTSAGEYHPTITAGSESTTVAVRIVTGSSGDQVTVNATVPPTFNFVISNCSTGNTDNLGNLSASSVVSSHGCDITVNTNAKTGWIAWAKDSNTGLSSTAVSKTIASTTPGTNTTLSNGTEGYVLGVTNIAQGSGAGTTSASAAYGNGTTGTAGAGQGSGLDGTLRKIASSTGTASSAVITVKEAAAISGITPAAGDYTDTITFVGAGSF